MNRTIGIYIALTILVIVVIFSCKPVPSEGERIYRAYCSNCHMDNGKGLGSLIPPLAQSDYLTNNLKTLPCLLLNGVEGAMTVNGIKYNNVMPAAKLDDVQLHNVINYIRTSWNNELGHTTIDEIKKATSTCK